MNTGYAHMEPTGLEAKRQTAIDSLTGAFASGALSVEEYERRVGQINAATHPTEILELVADLPATRDSRQAAYQPSSYSSRNADLVNAPSMNIGCIMGSRNYHGNWLSSDRVSSFTVMGSTVLDLRDSDLPPGPVKIEVFALMGDVRINVPANLPVKMNVTSIMADSRVNNGVNQRLREADTWLEINGFVMMGDVRVIAS